MDIRQSRHTGLIECLSRVACRERQRAITEFEDAHGRPYDGSSDHDWDLLDKDHVGIESSINVINAAYASDLDLQFV